MKALVHRIIQQRGACKWQLTCVAMETQEFVQSCTSVQTLEHKWDRLVSTFNRFIELFTEAIRDRSSYDYEHDNSNLLLSNTVDRLFEGQTQLLERIRDSSGTTELQFEKIRIPTYSGRYEDWCQFSDLFLGSVDKKSTLSKFFRCQPQRV